MEDARAYFGARAEAYRTSASHGNPEELGRMLRLLDPGPASRALDVATGGGHTALALAPRVKEVVASDVTTAMLAAVRKSARERGLANVALAFAEAHALPFRDGSFDAVTCRIAPHHFRDLGAFVAESARVLRPGGAFYAFDQTSPDDPEAAAVVDRVERLRDPSHVSSWAPGTWRRALDAAKLDVARLDLTRSEKDFEAWVARARMPPDRERELRRLLMDRPASSLGGFGLVAPGRMRIPRVEVLARKPA